MKKTFAAVFAGFLASAAVAGMDNVVVAFSTPGPDKYADGSTVLDGETYALVWTPTGSEFAGLNADGEAVLPSKTVLKAPVAKAGKCPFIQFEIDEDYAKDNYTNGTWGVYLCDTRVFAANAAGEPVATGALGAAVNGYGAVGLATGDRIASAAPVAGSAVATLPADKQEIKIRDIKVVDGNVYLYVSGTVSSASYGVQAGDTPAGLLPTDAASIGNTSGDMIIVRRAKPAGEFFQVNRK